MTPEEMSDLEETLKLILSIVKTINNDVKELRNLVLEKQAKIDFLEDYIQTIFAIQAMENEGGAAT